MTKHDEFEIPHSIDVFLPPDVQRVVDRLTQFDEHVLIIHDALWAMRAGEMTPEEQRAELRAELQKGLDSGPGIEVTPEFWANLKRRTEAWAQWIKTQDVGNTLLPEPLYRFVQDKVASGAFATPTEVVCEALRRLEEFRVAAEQEGVG